MPVHRSVDVVAAYAWRLLVIAAAGIGVLWLVSRLWVVFLSLVVAVLLTRGLSSTSRWLRHHIPAAPAAAAALLGLVLVLGLVIAAISVAVAGQVSDLEPTISKAVDDVEDWLVEDSPFDVSRRDIDEFRESLGDRASSAVRDSSGALVSGAVVAAEVLLSLVLGLIVTFFALKDGDRFLAWVREIVPVARSETAARMASRAWHTLGGYLRGAALLGLLEGTIIGITLWIVGADLAVPMAVVTFLAAFVPFAGAIVAGLLAVLVALATAGADAALIVLVVAFLVQQFDNEVLAPVVYGRALDLHPVVVLLGITAGGALFGVPGSFLAVPVTAVVWNVVAEAREARATGG